MIIRDNIDVQIEVDISDIIWDADRSEKEEMLDELLTFFDVDYIAREAGISYYDLELDSREEREIYEELKEQYDPNGPNISFKNPGDFRRYMCDLVGVGYRQLTDNELLEEIKKKL